MLTYTIFVMAALTAGDGAVDNLLPRPRQVEMAEGRYALPKQIGFILATPSAEEGERLSARLVECMDRLSLTRRVGKVTAGAADFTLTIGDCLLDTAPAPPPALEGYNLTITPKGLAIRASSEQGLFYGMMTLEQMAMGAHLEGKQSLPCLRIVDWPAISMRGPHEDFGRNQLPTMDDLKRSIRLTAQYKMNTYMWFIEPDHFVYVFDPEISTDYDRFTFDEIRELVAYAKQYYVDIVPVVELLAHMEMTLRHDKYQGLTESGRGGGTLCPTSDESFELVRKMVDEIAPAFDSVYFHCGLDESADVGQGRSRDAVAAKGIEQVYADYYTRMNDLIKSHGKTMVMYADIVLNHPASLDLLPKDIVMMFWDYLPRERYEGMDKLAAMGFPIMALSGLWDWCNLYPLYPAAFRNIEVLARQSAELKALGHFVSSWGDGYRGASGTNLSELDHFGYVYTGAVSWNTTSLSLDDFAVSFARDFFGSADPALSQALIRLAKCQGDDLSHVTQARKVFHDDLRATWAAMMETDDATVAFWRNLKTESAIAHKELANVRARKNKDYLKSVDLAARMLECSADMVLICRDAIAADKNPGVRPLKQLERRHRALWDEYQETWLATNRPINLTHIGKAWTGASDEIAALRKEVAAGTFPPKVVKGDRFLLDFDNENSQSIALAPAGDGKTEILPGGPSGQGSYLHLPHGSWLEANDESRLMDFGTAPFLVQTWVRHSGQREQQYGSTIFSYGAGGGFRVGINSKGEVLFTLYVINDIAGPNSIVPPDGAWHHVAVSFRAARHITMYVDGVLKDQLTMMGIPALTATPVIRVGNEIGLVTSFEGDIDRIRVSCGEYTPEELDCKP